MSYGEREERLKTVVENYRHVPFAWASHDCVLFAARCVDAQLGTHFEANIFRDYRYSNAISALRIVVSGGGWEAIIGRYLGPPVPAAQVEFGGVVIGHALEPFEATTLVGICDEEMFMAPDTNGLTWLPMSRATMGWNIIDIARRQRELLDV